MRAPRRRAGEGRYPGDGRGNHHYHHPPPTPPHRLSGPRSGTQMGVATPSTLHINVHVPSPGELRHTGETRYPGVGRGYTQNRHSRAPHSQMPRYLTVIPLKQPARHTHTLPPSYRGNPVPRGRARLYPKPPFPRTPLSPPKCHHEPLKCHSERSRGIQNAGLTAALSLK